MLLYPRHEIVDVLGSGALDRLLDSGPVCPVIFIPDQWEVTHTTGMGTVNSLWTCTHDWTGLGGALLCDSPIQHVDLVEEINS